MHNPNYRHPFADDEELFAADLNQSADDLVETQRRGFLVQKVRGLVRLDQPAPGPCNRFEVHGGELLVWQLACISADGTLYRGSLDRVSAGPGQIVYLPAPSAGERQLIALPPWEPAPSGAERLGTVTGHGFRADVPAWTLDAADELATGWGRLRDTLADYRRRHGSALDRDVHRQLQRVLRLSGGARLTDAVEALADLQAEAKHAALDPPDVTSPLRDLSVSAVLALVEAATEFYRKDEPMPEPIVPAVPPPPTQPPRPPRRRLRLAAALAAALLAAVGIASYCARPSPEGGPPAPPDVEGRASLGVDRLPVPAMLAEQQLAVTVADPSRTDARLLWQLYATGEATPRHAGELPVSATAAALAAEVLPKLGPDLSSGVLQVAVGPSLRPKWETVRLGVVLPRELTYVSSQRDPAGTWYTTARRKPDDALVSLWVSPDGSSLVGCDVWFVTVRAYLDGFLASPAARKHLLAAARQWTRFPVTIRSAEGRPETANDVERLAALLGRPFLDGPRPGNLSRWRAWPVAPYLRERFAVPVEPLEGASTDDFPVIGLSSLDGHAVALWMREQTGQPWVLARKPFDLPGTSVLSGPVVNRGEPGRLGLHWITGSLWHLQDPQDGWAATWGTDWRGVGARPSIPAEERPTNASFRLMITVPLTYSEVP